MKKTIISLVCTVFFFAIHRYWSEVSDRRHQELVRLYPDTWWDIPDFQYAWIGIPLFISDVGLLISFSCLLAYIYLLLKKNNKEKFRRPAWDGVSFCLCAAVSVISAVWFVNVKLRPPEPDDQELLSNLPHFAIAFFIFAIWFARSYLNSFIEPHLYLSRQQRKSIRLRLTLYLAGAVIFFAAALVCWEVSINELKERTSKYGAQAAENTTEYEAMLGICSLMSGAVSIFCLYRCGRIRTDLYTTGSALSGTHSVSLPPLDSHTDAPIFDNIEDQSSRKL